MAAQERHRVAGALRLAAACTIRPLLLLLILLLLRIHHRFLLFRIHRRLHLLCFRRGRDHSCAVADKAASVEGGQDCVEVWSIPGSASRASGLSALHDRLFGSPPCTIGVARGQQEGDTVLDRSDERTCHQTDGTWADVRAGRAWPSLALTSKR